MKTKLKLLNPATTRQAVLSYSIIFLFLAIIALSPLAVYGKGLVWFNGKWCDGLEQHYTALAYYGEYIRSFFVNLFTGNPQLPLWDYSLGYGNDIPVTFHYYCMGDPLALLSAFVPRAGTEYLYFLLVVLRFYLAGLGFVLFCKKMEKPLPASVLGAFLYVLCGFSLRGGIRHPFFMTPMILLPLILLGTEKIFRKERPYLFILTVFFAVISNFYFAYMLVVAVVIYIAVRYFTLPHEKKWGEIPPTVLKFAGFGLLGVGLAAIMLVPIITAYLACPRSGVANGVPPLYWKNFYGVYFTSFLGANSADCWTPLGYSALSLLAVAFMFMKKGKYTPLKVLFILLTAMQMIPLCGYIMNGFTYMANRFVFTYGMLMAYIAVATLDDLLKADKKEKILLLKLTAVYIVFVFTVGQGRAWASFALMPVLLLICLAVFFGDKIFKKNFRRDTKRAIAMLCLVGLIINTAPHFYPVFDNLHTQYLKWGTAEEKATLGHSTAFKEELNSDEFSRYERDRDYMINQSVLNGTHGVSAYWSFSGDSLSKYFREIGLTTDTNYRYQDLDRRAYLESLASVKYFIGDSDSGRPTTPPYGFKLAKEKREHGRDYQLYENGQALPLGYTYSAFMQDEVFQEMSTVERSEALMQGVKLEKKVEGFEELGRDSLQITSRELPFKTTYGEGIVTLNDDGFYVNKPDATLTLTFQGLPNSETYVVIDNAQADYLTQYQLRQELPEAYRDKIEHGPANIDLQKFYHSRKNTVTKSTVKAHSIVASNRFTLATPQYNFYSGVHDFTLNMGYSEAPQTYITLTFPSRGYYSFDKLAVVAQPMDNYTEYTDALSQEVMTDVELKTNGLGGKISLENDKLLCITLPYSSGWTAFVDGKKVELLQANTWCMALALEAGEHEIELKYFTPGLKLGAVISLLALLIFLGVVLLYRRRDRGNVENGTDDDDSLDGGTCEKKSFFKKVLSLVDIKLLKFLIVGGINTAIGMGIAFICTNLLHTHIAVSTVADYGIGSIISYFLNKHFTFQSKSRDKKEILRFAINVVVCLVLSYGIAKPTLTFLLSGLSQVTRDNIIIVAVTCLFTGFNYLGQRLFTFKTDEN